MPHSQMTDEEVLRHNLSCARAESRKRFTHLIVIYSTMIGAALGGTLAYFIR